MRNFSVYDSLNLKHCTRVPARSSVRAKGRVQGKVDGKALVFDPMMVTEWSAKDFRWKLYCWR